MKTERLQLRLEPEIKEKIEQLAKEEGRSVSNCAVNIIRKYLNQYYGMNENNQNN